MSLTIIRPTSDISNDTWIPAGGEDLYTQIDDEVTEQEDPSTETNISEGTGSGTCRIGLHNNVSGIITAIKVLAYTESTGDENEGYIEVTPYLSDSNLDADVINFYDSPQWNTAIWNNLNLSAEQVNDLELRLINNGNNSFETIIYALYVEITYTADETTEPLKKRTKSMSGYNYFCQNYILRKIKNLTPLKLPDGTLF